MRKDGKSGYQALREKSQKLDRLLEEILKLTTEQEGIIVPKTELMKLYARYK